MRFSAFEAIFTPIDRPGCEENFNAYGSCRPPPPEVWELRFEILGLTFEVWDFAVWDLNTREGVEVGILRVSFEVGDLGFEVLRFQIGVWSCFTVGSNVARVQYPGCALSKLARRPWRLGAVFPSQTRHCVGESLAILFFLPIWPKFLLKHLPSLPMSSPSLPKPAESFETERCLSFAKKRLCIGGSLARLSITTNH